MNDQKNERFKVGDRFMYKDAKEELFVVGEIYDLSLDNTYIFYYILHVAARRPFGYYFIVDSRMYRESVILTDDMPDNLDELTKLAGTLYG